MENARLLGMNVLQNFFSTSILVILPNNFMVWQRSALLLKYVKISVAVQLKFLVVLLSLELLLLAACLFDPSRMGVPTKTSQSI